MCGLCGMLYFRTTAVISGWAGGKGLGYCVRYVALLVPGLVKALCCYAGVCMCDTGAASRTRRVASRRRVAPPPPHPPSWSPATSRSCCPYVGSRAPPSRLHLHASCCSGFAVCVFVRVCVCVCVKPYGRIMSENPFPLLSPPPLPLHRLHSADDDQAQRLHRGRRLHEERPGTHPEGGVLAGRCGAPEVLGRGEPRHVWPRRQRQGLGGLQCCVLCVCVGEGSRCVRGRLVASRSRNLPPCF